MPKYSWPRWALERTFCGARHQELPRPQAGPCSRLCSLLGHPGRWGWWHSGVQTFFQKDLFMLHLTSGWTIKRETKPPHQYCSLMKGDSRIRKAEGSSQDYTGVSPWRNSLSGGSISAVLGGQLTSVPGSRTLFANNQTQACNEQLLDPLGPLAGAIKPPPTSPEEEVVFINKITFQIRSRYCFLRTRTLGASDWHKCHDFQVVVVFAFTFPQVAAAGINFRECTFQGRAFAISPSTVPSCSVSEAPGRVRRSCIIQRRRDHLVQRRSLAGIWVRGRLEELCSAELWFMHVGALTWSLEPLRSKIRPNSVSLGALIPAVQSGTADRTLRLRYQAHACSAGLSLLS